jgi:hypothetical protein
MTAPAPEAPPTAEQAIEQQAAAERAGVDAARSELEGLERAFAADQRNDEWARSQEEMLRQSLAESGAPADVSEVECRAQLCRAVVRAPDSASLQTAAPTASEEIGGALMQRLGLTSRCGFSLFGPLPGEQDPPALRAFIDCRPPTTAAAP